MQIYVTTSDVSRYLKIGTFSMIPSWNLRKYIVGICFEWRSFENHHRTKKNPIKNK